MACVDALDSGTGCTIFIGPLCSLVSHLQGSFHARSRSKLPHGLRIVYVETTVVAK